MTGQARRGPKSTWWHGWVVWIVLAVIFLAVRAWVF